MEDGGSKEKTDNDTATTNHGDDRNHSTGDAQRIEIHEVCNREEDADAQDAPVPVELVFLPARPPNDDKHDKHHGRLVDIVPGLHGHTIDAYTSVGWRAIRNLSYKPLTAPRTAAATMQAIHLLCEKLMPSRLPERLSIRMM